jgi:polysaccharide biosynthesis protein PslJ
LSLTALHPVDLEPSLVDTHTYATRRLYTRIDTAGLLSTMIVVLYVFPGTLIVPNMTYAGRPALLLAFGLFCWWVLTRLHPKLAMTGPQPIRWVAMAYLIATLLSYLAGVLRGLPVLEANAQNFALLLLFEFIGVMLVAADGIPNWERLKGVLRMMVWCAGFMAVVGIVQSTFKYDITQYFAIPGLDLHGGTIGLARRGAGDFFRVAGTATHYIEFSALMAIAVPFAIHFARFAPDRRHRRAAVLVALLCTAAVAVSISRTGIVALAAACLVMLPAWEWRTRYNLMFFGVCMVGVLMVVRPGLLGTIKAMFTSINDDPSIKGRTNDYELVGRWFSERPWLGRGPNTLIPELYGGMVLDNQWLYTAVTAGIVGVTVFAMMHLTGITLAAIAMRRSSRAEDRHLCAALIAALVISMVAAATFDSFYYTTLTTTLALLTGICGTVWRLTHPARTVRTSTVRRFVD